MAKEKDSTLSKEERKALKRAEKEKKTKPSDSDGVHKSKDSKKEKRKERTALAEKVANAVESGKVVVVDDEEVIAKSDVQEDENEGKKKDKRGSMRPVGALVPFANPLADEKVAKKVFKGVKKGVCLSTSIMSSLVVVCSDFPLPPNSRSIEIPQTRRQRGCQSAPEISNHTLLSSTRCGGFGSRYLSHGRHLAHSSPL